MALGCAANTARVLLIIVNIIFLLSGLVLIAIGVWMIADPDIHKIVDFVVDNRTKLFDAAAGLMIAIGGLAVIVSVIGLAAAITENAILLTVYIVLLFIIFLGEIACGILAIVYQDKIEEEANKSMTHSIQRSMKANNPYYNGTGRVCMASDDGEIWDYIQVKFECCGAGSYALSGYENAEIYLPSICPQLNLKANKPLTCCSHRVVDMDTIDSANQSSALDKFDCDQIISYGCTDAIVDWIAKYAPVLIGVGIGLGMFELIIILFALCVCQHRDTKD